MAGAVAWEEWRRDAAFRGREAIGTAIMAALALMGRCARGRWLRRHYGCLLAALIRRTELFDRAYYLEANEDVRMAGMSPLQHYARFGDREGRCPMPLFDPRHYRAHARGIGLRVNTLLHYHFVGRYRGYPTCPWFDTGYYLACNEDVRRIGVNPLLHFVRWGGLDGRSPAPNFDGEFYLREYPDVRRAGINPLVHYVLQGRYEGRMAKPLSAWDAGWHMVDEDSAQSGEDGAATVGTWEDIEERRRPPSGEPVVDVVIPVYRDRALTWRCIRSVLTARVETPHEVVVIDDESPEEDLRADLREMARRGWIRLLRNERNRGFVRSANRGMMLHGERDVVLLNSDTEVYDGWLDRLRAAAYRASDVASVTPLSNNATICSYPVFLEDNPYPVGVEYRELDRLTAEVNEGVLVEAPTGVGFCMYLRRDAIDEVGIFDEKAFGRGYGEENDWCQRAIRKGWRNLIAADTYVRHIGSASFRDEKVARAAEGLETMRRRYPRYEADVHRFIAEDPLREARRRLDWARLQRQVRNENVLFVCHARGGGAERHLREDLAKAEAEGMGAFILRPVRGHPTHVYIEHLGCRATVNLPLYRLADTESLGAVLRELGITRIHSHGLVDFQPEAAELLHDLAKSLDVPLWVDIHDYKVICPRLNLAREDGRYCGEPEERECDECLRREGNGFGVYDIRGWREMHARVLAEAERVVVPDADVAERLRRYFPALEPIVEPHETFEVPELRLRSRRGDRVRVVTLGAISRIKGYDVLLACARHARKKKMPLDFVLMGYSMDDGVLSEVGVRVTGPYQDAEAMRLLEELDPDVAFLPALWPETYSYTLSIALKQGLPVVAFDIGAVASRLRSLGREAGLLPLDVAGNPEIICQRILQCYGVAGVHKFASTSG